jgi:hypothetical protein
LYDFSAGQNRKLIKGMNGFSFYHYYFGDGKNDGETAS